MDSIKKAENTYPRNWGHLTLREIVIFTIGGDWGKLPVKNTAYREVKVIRGTDYKNWDKSRADFASVRMIQESSLIKRRLELGNIVIEISGGGPDQPVGRSIIIDSEALNEPLPLVCSNFFRKLKISESISPFFVNYFLQYSYKSGEYNKMQTETTNLRNLQFETFLNQTIPLPCFQEQVDIAEKLDELFVKIRQSQDILDKIPLVIKTTKKKILASAFSGELTKEWRKLNKPKPCIINEKFTEEKIEKVDKDILPSIPKTWRFELIGDLTTFIGSGTTPKGKNKYASSGIPFIRSQNVYPEGIVTNEATYITEELHEKMSRTQLRPNDVLLNITGASIGRATFLPTNFTAGNINQHVCIIRFAENILPEYAAMFLNSEIGQKQIFSSQTGVTREGLNYSQIRGMWLPLITVNEQIEIVKIVNKLFDKISLFQKKYLAVRENVELLPYRLLQDAFSGNLINSHREADSKKELLNKIECERKEYATLLKEMAKKIVKKPMSSQNEKNLKSKLQSKFANKRFAFRDIQSLFEGDYETSKEQFYQLIKSKKITFIYNKNDKCYNFLIN